jgi:hypothetical protein
MQEEWKPVVGYEGLYEVSNLGRIKSLPRNRTIKKERFLKYQLRSGYYSVRLYKNSEFTDIKVHQIVAISFLGYNRNGKQDIVVDHINNNKLDNNLINLQLITQRENSFKNKKSNCGYTGVYKNKYGKYRASIKITNKYVHLGYYTNIIDAHLAYQNKLKEIQNGK